LERYVALVYCSALRRTGNQETAMEVAQAVFLVLARRARRLRKKTVLAAWLFHVTSVACRKLPRDRDRARYWFRRSSQVAPLPEETLWRGVGRELDLAIDRLRPAPRKAVLLRGLLNKDCATVAQFLRTTEVRAGKYFAAGLKKLVRRLRKKRVPIDPDSLAQLCSAKACADPLPNDLTSDILASINLTLLKKPGSKLARRTLNALAWSRWVRRFAIAVPTFLLLLSLLGGSIWYVDSLTGHSRLMSLFIVWWVRFEIRKAPGLTAPARAWHSDKMPLDARAIHDGFDLYQTTNIWPLHLSFTREQWKALEPEYIGPLPNFARADGFWLLRNPNARRSGLAGVLGYQFDWTHAEFGIGNLAFSNVAVRAKGNMVSLCWPKRSFKVDLNRFAKGQKLGALDELTLNSLVWDYSCLSDALGYEFFRDAGVPSPRTAYAWLSTSLSGQWYKKPSGLYLMVEPVDKAFAADRFGAKNTAIFKPVTYNLFEHLGEDWSAYAPIYDLKTKATPEEQRRIIEFARLVSFANDAEFAARVAEFLDLDEFARFLAAEVLLSNYDSILLDGQNFYMYLDPRSKKLGFIPWDLDSCWGDFWIGTTTERERASIWHPWVGQNRFIERVMAVEDFRRVYRGHLEKFLEHLFQPQRLHRRIDDLAAIIRDPIAAESPFRLDKFEQSVGLRPLKPLPGETSRSIISPAHPLKHFIEARYKSVRKQLDGKSPGVILKQRGQK
jgi:spore coat protein CotH/DNA-directed RNA polymerase specialized sigma24 family protein